jgi:small subunit ribosomal protein S4
MDLFKGSLCKYSRSLGRKVDNKPEEKSPLSRRGPRRKMKKQSDFGKHLIEVQVCRLLYGIRERQFRNYFKKAKAKAGNTAEVLLVLLERRLDNALFRCGMAASRRQARQLVAHRHLLVNGRCVDRPSFSLSAGDVFEVKPSKVDKAFFKGIKEEVVDPKSGFWLKRAEGGAFKYSVERFPLASEAEQAFNAAHIVEYYSKYV